MAPVSFSAVNPANTLLSPCRVSFKGVDLGGTLGNVSVSFETEKSEIKMDQLGTGPIDRVISKQLMKVSFEITEVRLKDNWSVVFPHMHLITSGLNKAIYSDSQIGRRDQDDAGSMVLHPLALPDADKSGDHLFYKMISDGTSEIVYGPGEQVRLKFSGIVLPDFTTQPVRFFLHGDPSIGLISASAGAPSFTGNGGGTMGSISVFNGYTQTETLTATCVTPVAAGGVFEVAGSVSGPHGLATVGVAFVSPVVSFTLSDGTPDFALNDSFSLSVIASNYV